MQCSSSNLHYIHSPLQVLVGVAKLDNLSAHLYHARLPSLKHLLDSAQFLNRDRDTYFS